jgi:hypothetical protein
MDACHVILGLFIYMLELPDLPKKDDANPKKELNVSLRTLIKSMSPKREDTEKASINAIIPNFVSKEIRNICAEKIRCETPFAPKANEAFAAVVMVDVSGYSKLTATLARAGPTGSEILYHCMKKYLDQATASNLDYTCNSSIWW